jgi:hypothetical protein
MRPIHKDRMECREAGGTGLRVLRKVRGKAANPQTRSLHETNVNLLSLRDILAFAPRKALAGSSALAVELRRRGAKCPMLREYGPARRISGIRPSVRPAWRA